MSISSIRSNPQIQVEHAELPTQRYVMGAITLMMLVIVVMCFLVFGEVNALNTPAIDTPILSYATVIAITAVVGGLILAVLYVRQIQAIRTQIENLSQTNLKFQQEAEAHMHARDTLIKNAERYRVITELISDYAYSTYIEPDGTMQREWLTDSFYTMTGYTLEDVGIQASVAPRTHPDDISQVEQDLQRTLTGEDTVSEYRWRIKSGEYIWIRVKRRPIWDDEQKRIIRIIAGVSNITIEKEAELALRESEERYRIITELISDSAFMMNVHTDGSLEQGWLTTSYFKNMGYSKDDLPEKPTVAFTTHPDDIEQAEKDLQRVLAGEMVNSEFRSRTKSGIYRWLRSTRFPIWDEEHNQVIRYYGVAQDITEQKEAELALRQSEDRYRKLTELISDYAFLIRVDEDNQLQLDWVTPSYYRIMGYNEDDITDDFSLSTVGHPDDVDTALSDLKRVLQGETVVSEFRYRTKSGNYIWLQTSREPVWDDKQRRVISYYGIAKDITAQKEAELALRQSEDRYRKLTELISDYAFSLTVDEERQLKLDWITPSYYRVMGYSEDDISNDFSLATNTHPDDADLALSERERVLQGETVVSEFRSQTKSGEYIWLQTTREPVWDDEQQRVVSYYEVARNITAQKKAEQALQDSEERYRRISSLLSDFAYEIRVTEDRQMELDWVIGNLDRISDVSLSSDYLKNIQQNVHPDDKIVMRDSLLRTLENHSTTTEYRVVADEGFRWLRSTRDPVWDEAQQRVVRILGTIKDITDEKIAQDIADEMLSRYRHISDIISDYAYSLQILPDGETNTEWLMGSFEEITGISSEQFVFKGKTPSIVVEGDKERVQADMNLAYQGQRTVSEYRIIHQKTKQIRWIRVSRQPVMDESGQVIRIFGAAQDITTIKTAEQALQQSQDRYREISELISDYAFSINIDPDGNRSLDWMVGSYEDITGNEQPIIVSEEGEIVEADNERLQQDIERTIKQGVKTSTEYRIYHQQTGDIRWLRVSRKPIWDETERRVIRFIGAASDITAQKQAELASQENQRRYQDVSQMMSDYAFSVTITEENQQQIDWVAGSIEHITGIKAETLGSPKELAQLAHPDDRDRLSSSVDLTLAGQKTLMEYRIIHAATMEIRWLRISRQPMWNEDRTRVNRILVAATDITAQKEAELASRESEERYRLVSELISDYVFSMKVHEDYSTEIDWFAGSYESILGASSDAKWESMLANQTHPDDYARVLEDVWKTNYGETTVSEYRIVSATDQSIRWVRVSRQPVWDEEQNRVVRVISAAADITVEKEALESLRRSEKRYRMITDLISDFVYSLGVTPDNQLSLEWHAGSFEEISGVSLEEYNIQAPADMIRFAVDDDMPQSQSDIQLTLQGQRTTSEYRIINAKDQKHRWIRASRYPIWDENEGRVVRILGATTDITAQKQAEQALRDTEERYRLLTELMTDYCFSVRINEDGTLFREWLMGDFEGIMGYSIPYSANLSDKNSHPAHADNYEIMRPDMQLTIQGQSTVAEYHVTNKKDNQPRWIRVTRQPIWNAERTRVIQYLGAVKNITLEKAAEAVSHEANQLRQDLEREKGLHELRSRFVSMVTHEFRNPLAAIQSSASILEKFNERISAESRQEKFDRIYGQIERMTNLLEDLLQIGELEDSGLSIIPRRIDLLEIIGDLYAEYGESIGLDHHLELMSSHDKIMTFGDESLLRQAIGNIVSNAIKYSPAHSTVTCDVRLDGTQIVIDVIDEGMGVPQADVDQIFEAFFRASNVSTQPGTGLGLIIAQRSIELHDGTIEFTTELGTGTMFTITIPQVIGKEGDE